MRGASWIQRQWTDWAGHELGVSRLSLRFNSKGLEDGYVRSRQRALIKRSRMFIAAGVLAASSFVLLELLVIRSLEEKDALDHMIQIFVNVFIVAMGMSTLMALGSRPVLRHVGPAALEVWLTLLICVAVWLTVLSEPGYVNKLRKWRHSPYERIPTGCAPGSDATNVLLIYGAVATVHIGLPVRWHVLLILQTMALGLYAVMVFVIGSIEDKNDDPAVPAGFYNLFLLAVLIFVSSMGKQSSELADRQAFKDIIDERSRRCRAEFQLSAFEEKSARRRVQGAESDNGSLPTTTATGNVFNAMLRENDDMQSVLAQIATIVDSEHWRIQASEVRLRQGDLLGKGGFGIVVRGAFCGMAVAVKMPRGGRMGRDAARRLPELCNELRVLRRLKHPNIVTVMGVVIEPEQCLFALVLELVNGNRLDRFLHATPGGGSPSASTVDASTRYCLMSGVCLALLYMHTRRVPVIHGDLKPSNILVEVVVPGGVVRPRLLDFGLSRVLARGAHPLGGTYAWMPPECYRTDMPLRCSADVYSTGRLLAFIAADAMPMAGMNSRSVRRVLAKGTPQLPTWPPGCVFEAALRPLVERCLATQVSARPTMVEIHSALVALPVALGLDDAVCEMLPLPDEGGSMAHTQHLEQPAQGGAPAVAAEAEARAAPQNNSNADAEEPGPSQQAANPPNDGDDLAAAALATPSPGCSLPEVPRQPLYTSMESLMISLCETIHHWSLPPGERRCCDFHSRMQAAEKVLGALSALACRSEGTGHDSGGQCPQCGILGLDDEDSRCGYCGCQLSDRDGAPGPPESTERLTP